MKTEEPADDEEEKIALNTIKIEPNDQSEEEATPNINIIPKIEHYEFDTKNIFSTDGNILSEDHPAMTESQNDAQFTSAIPKIEQSELGIIDIETNYHESGKIENSTGGIRIHECVFCLKVFTTESDWTNHDCESGERKHKCDVCGKIFFNPELFEQHLKIHGPESSTSKKSRSNPIETSYTCTVCGKVYTSIYSLRHHDCEIDTSGTKSPEGGKYKCYVCEKYFTLRKSLLQHLKIHDEKKFQCDMCDKSFPVRRYLRQHKITHSKSDKTIECHLCDAKFHRKVNLKRHLRQHSGSAEKNLKCGLCDKAFSLRSALKHHMISHNGKLHKCSLCDREFVYKNSLKNHVATHTGEYRMHECRDCGEVFASNYFLKKHDCEKNNRNEEIEFECGKISSSDKGSEVHLNSHSEKKGRTESGECKICGKTKESDEERTGECKICGNSTASDEKCRSECKICGNSIESDEERTGECKMCGNNAESDEKRTGECKICGKTFPSRIDLVMHSKTHHECKICGQTCVNLHSHASTHKQFACTLCDQRFYRSSGLKAHSRYHDAGKKLTCAICSYSCNLEINMSIHMTGAHRVDETSADNGEEFACARCGQTFRRASSLKAHLRYHDAGKKITCAICSYGSNFKRNMSIHMKKAHGLVDNEDENHKCSVCDYAFKYSKSLQTHLRTVHHATCERIYTCTVCDCTFKSASTLTKHSKKIHMVGSDESKAGKLTCTECSYTFKVARNLTIHLRRIHGIGTDEGKIACKVCNHTFKNLKNYAKHLKNVHGLESEKVSDASESTESEEVASKWLEWVGNIRAKKEHDSNKGESMRQGMSDVDV